MQKVAVKSIDSQRKNILSIAGDCADYGLDIIPNNICAYTNVSNRINEIDGTYGFDVDNFNSSLGIEHQISDKLYAGIAYGHGTSNLSNYQLSNINASIDSKYNYSTYLIKNSQITLILNLSLFANFDYDSEKKTILTQMQIIHQIYLLQNWWSMGY